MSGDNNNTDEINIKNGHDSTRSVIKVGSRKSQLALIQTEFVISQLEKIFPDLIFEIVQIATIGDKILNQALSKIGEKSLFTKELEIALENKEVAFVVHSLKDLPTTLPEGMVIGAIGKREDPSDALVVRKNLKATSLSELAPGSVIGTSSLRRIAQLTRSYPHLKFANIRGNLNTRLTKLDEKDDYAALVLATAGLKRLNWEKRITQSLAKNDCMHAVGQGALAVECRANDDATLAMLAELSHRESTLKCVAERAFMKRLGGGCSVPIGVATELSNEGRSIELWGGVFSLDGAKSIQLSAKIELEDENENGQAVKKIKTINDDYCGVVQNKKVEKEYLKRCQELGEQLADDFLAKGAKDILDEARLMNEKSG